MKRIADGNLLIQDGFSVKLGGPEVTRLFFDELRERSRRQTKTPRKPRAGKRSVQSRRVNDPRKRAPLVTFGDLQREFAVALAAAGISQEEAESSKPIIAQTRISRLEQGRSTSPARQVEALAAWFVKHRFRPVALVHEETSGSIFKARRRVRFEQFFEDIENDRVRDPRTGALIDDIACFFYDRFTRDPDEGGDWLRLLRRKGMNLHETYYDEEPRPLHLVEHDIRAAWVKAAKDVERDRERVLSALTTLAKDGRPTYGQERLFGHEAVRNTLADGSSKVIGYRANATEAAAIRYGVENVIAGGSIYSWLCWLNENGHTNSNGGKFTFNQAEGVLTSPRIAGLVRLRTDRARLQDETYEGELFPKELIYDESDTPVPYEAPIEPIVPYPQWRRLQEVIRSRKRKRGPREQHLASSFVTCSECGDLIVGGRSGKASFYRCPKNHLHGRKRDEADRTLKIAHDGKRHPTMKREVLDYVLAELTFAAVERVLNEDDAAAADHAEIEREDIRRKIAALDERLGNISYMLGKTNITRAQYDEWTREIDADRALLTARVTEISNQRPQELLPPGTTLRDLWPDMDVERKRAWIALIFGKIVLKPASDLGALDVAARLEIEFRPGYNPPREEVDALLAELDRRVRARTAPNRLSAAIEQRIIEFHEQGLSPSEIRDRLIAAEVETPRGGKWDRSYVASVLRRAYAERGEEWVPHGRDRTRLSKETRELIGHLNEKLPSYAAVARELNGLGIRTVTGRDWTSHSVRNVFLTTTAGGVRAVDRTLPPRPGSLSPAMRETLWRMHRQEGRTLGAIARWLKTQGIKTATGKENWDASTILYIVRRVDAAKSTDAQTLSEAA